MDDERRWSAAYLLLQGGLVGVWWLALATSPSVREWFELDPDRRDVLNAFVLADLVVMAAGSIAAGIALLRRSAWAGIALGALAGGSAYATLYLVAWVLQGGDGRWGLAPMVAATTVTGAIAVRQAVRQAVRRRSSG